MATLKISGALEAARATAQLEKDFTGPAMLQVVLNEARAVAATARDNASVDTGRYRDGIVATARMRGFWVEGVVEATAPHSVYAHNGSAPHWPPVSALRGWAARHGLNAYLVARSIARKGTKGDRAVQRAFEAHERGMLTALVNAVGRFVAKWGTGG